MTKTLTEQWREGTLPDGYYYVVSKWSGKIEINDYYEGCWQDLKEEYIKEILAPVPSYDEWERLQEQLNEANEVIKFFANSQIGKKNKDGTCGFWLCSGDVAFDNPLERINNKMKYTCYDPRPAKKWLKKWGVK